ARAQFRPDRRAGRLIRPRAWKRHRRDGRRSAARARGSAAPPRQAGRGIRHRQRMARASRRQLLDASPAVTDRELADREVLRRLAARFRHNLQGISSVGDQARRAVWGFASLHPGTRQLSRRANRRGPDRQHRTAEEQIALRAFADLAGHGGSDYGAFPASLFDAAAAHLRSDWICEPCRRRRRRRVCRGDESLHRCAGISRARTVAAAQRRPAAVGCAPHRPGCARRNPHAHLLRRSTTTDLHDRPGDAAVSHERRPVGAMSTIARLKASRYVSIGAAAAGALLLAWSLRTFGTANVINNVRRLGAGFIVIVALGGLRHLVRSIAWRLCFDDPATLSIGDSVAAYISGDAIGNVTPFGIFASEPSK